MFGLVALGVELVLCFVLVDFAIEQRWAVLAVVLVGGALVSWSNKLLKRRLYKGGMRKGAQSVGGGAALGTGPQQVSGAGPDGTGGGRAFASSGGDLKQGGYGKVQVFKASKLSQLCRPSEVAAMVQCKVGVLGRGGGGESSGLAFGLGGLGLSDSDVEFCETKLKEVSRSFAQVITFLPNSERAPVRLGVGAFYLVLRALDTVEDDMDLSKFDEYVEAADKERAVASDCRLACKQRLLRGFAGRLRALMADPDGGKHSQLDKRLAGFGEGHERVLLDQVDVLARVMARLPREMSEVVLDITLEMGNGMADYIARDLRNGTDDAADFERYCHIAAGTVGDGLTRLFASCGLADKGLARRRDLWDAMGSFLQRVNIIRDYLEDYVDGRAWWPKSVWQQYTAEGASLAALAHESSISSEPSRSLACLEHMIADALDLVPSCVAYIAALADGPNQRDAVKVLSFCALPQIMAAATIAECYDNQNVFRGVVKIRKGQAARIIVALAPMTAWTGAPRRLQDVHHSAIAMFQEFVAAVHARAERKMHQTPQTVRLIDQCERLDELFHASLAKISGAGPSTLKAAAAAHQRPSRDSESAPTTTRGVRHRSASRTPLAMEPCA